MVEARGLFIAIILFILLTGGAACSAAAIRPAGCGPAERYYRSSQADSSGPTGVGQAGRTNTGTSLFDGIPFDLRWSRTPGGSSDDDLISVISTPDKGYIAVGKTSSPGIPRYHSGDDVWVVWFNAKGKTVWQKCYGGNGNEYGSTIIRTRDGNFVFVAATDSNRSGDVRLNHGAYDLWVVKITPAGKIIWSRLFGGSSDEPVFGCSIGEDPKGNIIVTTDTDSNDGNVAGSHGGSDIWFLKLNRKGKLVWSRCYGGSSDEIASEYPAYMLANGNYLYIGSTESNDQQVSGNHGYADALLLEINRTTGSLDFAGCYGGHNYDYGDLGIQTRRGNFLVSVASYSDDEFVAGNHGLADAWVAELLPDRSINWSACFGGADIDVLFNAKELKSGSYLLTGRTYSDNGDIGDTHGNGDGWVLELNRTGGIAWQRCFGGSGEDGLVETIPRSANEYVAIGWTTSNDGDIFGSSHGLTDGWLAYFGINTSWPPGGVTRLRNTTYAATYINWTWNDPKSPDFGNVTVYLNGMPAGNVSRGVRSYNATGLSPGSRYTLGTHTVDIYGNVNAAWVNSTAWTR